MGKWTLFAWHETPCHIDSCIRTWLTPPQIEDMILIHPSAMEYDQDLGPRVAATISETFIPGKILERLLQAVKTDYLAIIREQGECAPRDGFFQRMEQVFRATGAGCLYSYYQQHGPDQWEDIILPRYQAGSGRDTFPMGRLLAFRVNTLRQVLQEDGPLATTRWAGLTEVVLRLSRRNLVACLPETLYTCRQEFPEDSEKRRFAYLRNENEGLQAEMEDVFTSHLRTLGALLPPPSGELPEPMADAPVVASVVIPVRNRARTIGEAIASAASQVTDFPFNILVVDNYSTDSTTSIITNLMTRHTHLRRLVPPGPGRGIGGCWQHAIFSDHCGLYAVQLDSDDLYERPDALQTMVDCLRSGPHAMAVGAYRVVDDQLHEMPPGLVAHHEWTPQNGHNNLLRVEGIGAPRAYYVPALRQVGFPDVSYGEDYAAALALSRRWSVGRVFDSLYLCRRWEGNSDSRLSSAREAAHHEYKDFLRSCELAGRRGLAIESWQGSLPV